MTKHLTLIATLFLAGPALAGSHAGGMGDMDSDGDGMMSAEEYGMGQAEIGFSAYDYNSDGILSEDEVPDALGFTAYDIDGDGGVTMEEYTEASFDYWDEDGDGMLDEDEFAGMVDAEDAMSSD